MVVTSSMEGKMEKSKVLRTYMEISRIMIEMVILPGKHPYFPEYFRGIFS